jgi:hypothetical protein
MSQSRNITQNAIVSEMAILRKLRVVQSCLLKIDQSGSWFCGIVLDR